MPTTHEPTAGCETGQVGLKLDPSGFARQLRELALETHRLLLETWPSTSALLDLEHRIDELREFSRPPRMIEVDCWLQNARARIEERVLESRLCHGLEH